MKSVVVTGASTGIGWGCVKVLTSKGFHVFGSVRKQADADRLSKEFGAAFTPLLFDVTDEAAVHAAARGLATKLAGQTLAGLVNNAGIAKMGPLGLQPLKDFEAHFAVNVFGMLRMTQAALPLLGSDAAREGAPGRIVTITSVGGRIAAPFLGAYTATKHANEAMTDTLRRELNIYGIDAIAIGPGSVKTPIWDKAEKDNSSGPYDASDWAEPLQTFQEVMLNGGRTGLEPERIARVVEAALSDAGPRARYAPVPQKLTNFIIPTHLPKRLLDKIFISRFGLQRR